MELQLKIEFNQLVQIAKKLSARQWIRLKNEVENNPGSNPANSELESFLLNAPTFSKKQILEIEKARKSINQWRIK